MKKLFQVQIENSTPINQIGMDCLAYKTYESGKEIKENDTILYAFKESEPYDKEGVSNVDVDIITLCLDEIDMYEYDPESIDNVIPIIIKKK
jgi:hypothetical protein